MNKTELISAIAEKTGSTKVAAEAFVNAFTDVVEGAVAEGDKVTLVGFGVFERRHRKARVAASPRDGSKIDIPASNAPVFKAGKGFKDKVNK